MRLTLMALMFSASIESTLAPGYLMLGLAPETPYWVARVKLMEAGFTPVRVFKRDSRTTCGPEYSPCYRELVNCDQLHGGWVCRWLWRRSDGVLVVAQTYGQSTAKDKRGPPGFAGVRETFPYELAGLVIGMSDGQGRELIKPPPPPSPRKVPLCSETPDGKDCWVKPPPGYRK